MDQGAGGGADGIGARHAAEGRGDGAGRADAPARAAGGGRSVVVPPGALDATVELVAALKAQGFRVFASLTVADAQDVRRLLEAGADGFVGAGREERAPATAPEPMPPPSFGLTVREVEVLRFLGAGFSNKEVARRLDVSVRTIETHRFNLRRKTQAGRLKDLVRLARRMGLSAADEAPREAGYRVASVRPAEPFARAS